MALGRWNQRREACNEGERMQIHRRGAIRNHRAIHMIGSVEFIMRR
jgi:hypothetical protein